MGGAYLCLCLLTVLPCYSLFMTARIINFRVHPVYVTSKITHHTSGLHSSICQDKIKSILCNQIGKFYHNYNFYKIKILYFILYKDNPSTPPRYFLEVSVIRIAIQILMAICLCTGYYWDVCMHTSQKLLPEFRVNLLTIHRPKLTQPNGVLNLSG